MAAFVAILIVTSGDALAQTSSTSTTSTTASSSTSTTVNTTTTTPPSPPHPCAGAVCVDEPPDAVLSAATGQVRADRDGYCWQGAADASTRCVVPGRVGPYTPATLVVTRGETVTVTFPSSPHVTPTEVALRREGQETGLVAANPTQFEVDLPPGTYQFVEGLRTLWVQGKVFYSFGIEVRAALASPATPSTARPLALTG